MAIRIVSLTAKLGLDGTAFQQGMQRAGRTAADWTGGLKRQLAGAFAATAMVGYVRNLTTAVGRIKDLSEQFSITTDEVQQLDQAAVKSGQKFENIGAALIKLGNQRREAVDGNEELRASFAQFGVTMNDLSNDALRNVDIFQMIASAVQTMNLNARQSDDLNNLLGARNGEKLAAVMRDLEKTKVDLISPEAIERIDRATKQIELLKLNLQELATRLPDLNFWDFIPGMMGMPEDQKKQAGMSKDEVAAENARRNFREQQKFEEQQLSDEAMKAMNKAFLERLPKGKALSMDEVYGRKQPALPDMGRNAREIMDILSPETQKGIARSSERTAETLERILQEMRRNQRAGGGPFGSQ